MLLDKILLKLRKNITINLDSETSINNNTIEQVHKIVNKIELAMKRNAYCLALFLDVTKEFGKVWHLGLKHKIATCTPLESHDILLNYLDHGRFKVSCNVHKSKL